MGSCLNRKIFCSDIVTITAKNLCVWHENPHVEIQENKLKKLTLKLCMYCIFIYGRLGWNDLSWHADKIYVLNTLKCFLRFYSHCEGYEPTLLLIRTTEADVSNTFFFCFFFNVSILYLRNSLTEWKYLCTQHFLQSRCHPFL